MSAKSFLAKALEAFYNPEKNRGTLPVSVPETDSSGYQEAIHTDKEPSLENTEALEEDTKSDSPEPLFI